jgi:hypothetical protein
VLSLLKQCWHFHRNDASSMSNEGSRSKSKSLQINQTSASQNNTHIRFNYTVVIPLMDGGLNGYSPASTAIRANDIS